MEVHTRGRKAEVHLLRSELWESLKRLMYHAEIRALKVVDGMNTCGDESFNS